MKTSYTQGAWTATTWDRQYHAIRSVTKPPSNLSFVIALLQSPGVSGPVPDEERLANIKLVEKAPDLFNTLLRTNDLLFSEEYDEAHDVVISAIEQMTLEQPPATYKERFKYLIIRLDHGSVRGTNISRTAMYYGNLMGYLVIDTEKQELFVTSYETESVKPMMKGAF